MDRQKYIGDISTYLSAIHYRLNDINKAGFFDINRCMETTFTNVLNIIYDYKLINLNTVHVGEPAIDLIDDEKHVCVQVTSTNTIQKVNGTLEKLKKTKRDVNDYRLIVLILKDEKKPRVNHKIDAQFKFDPEKDILTIASLISAISGLEIDKLKKLLICLKQEFGGTFNSNYIEDIEKIIGISSPFIKAITLKYLSNDPDADLLNTIINFDSIKKTSQWNNLDDVFKSYINNIRVDDKGNSNRYVCENSIFDTMYSKIRSYKKRSDKICMIIKGNYRTGKSMFSSLLYLYLMNESINHKYEKIPFYINLEKVNSHDLFTEFNDILDKANTISIKYNRNICLILDGIPQFIFDPGKNNNIEKIYNTITGDKYASLIDSLILCIDTNSKLSYEFSSFYTYLKSDNLVYADQITIQNQIKSSRDKVFINAFCRLENNTSAKDNVINNIDSLKLKSIDFCTLTTLKDSLFLNNSIDLAKELEMRIVNKLEGSTADINMASRIAYMIYYDHLPFTTIHNCYRELKDNKAVSKVLQLVLCNELFAHFLIAAYYVNEIKGIIEAHKGAKYINRLQVLRKLYGDEICSFIVGYIQLHNLGEYIKKFSEKWFEKLCFCGQSMCVYILGRIHNGRYLNIENLQCFDNAIDANYEAQPNLSAEERYNYYIAKRSLAISRMRVDKEYHDNNEYILLLLDDKRARKVNRDFYLEYYGDRLRSDNIHKNEQDTILKGLDFFKTYQILAANINQYQETEEEYPLFRLELFTLCDLIQTRLDHPYITHKRNLGDLEQVNAKKPEFASFFYNAAYNSEFNDSALVVISFITGVLEKYVKKNENYLDSDIFIQYLNYEKTIFKEVECKLKECKSDFCFGYSNLLEKMINLENVRRIGWNIKEKTKSIEQDAIDKICQEEQVYENVLQHTYEMFLIALLYLPEYSKSEGYKKQEVLNMIWIHDLGEAVITDYPPFFKDFVEKKEQERTVCQQYYFAGTHPHYATMIKYLELWNNWSSSTGKNRRNINTQIAIDIDKLQMIYKLLTMVNKGVLTIDNFNRERFDEVYDCSNRIVTSEVKEVFNTIIANNLTLKKKIKEVYNFSISTLE